MRTVRDYIFGVRLDAYIKQYLTFKIMEELYPQNILLIKYEELVRSPRATFINVLSHFGHDVNNSEHLEKIEQALALSSKDSMQKIENLIGHSLGNDQIIN